MKKKNSRFTGMRSRLHLIICLAGIIAGAAACSKGGTASSNPDDGSHGPLLTDTIPPTLDVYTPTADQVFTSGNSINVTGRITDDLGLYRGSIRIVNDANGNLLYEQLYEIHFVLAYNFNISFPTSVTIPSNYTVTVSFEDHGLNAATKSVKVKVNP